MSNNTITIKRNQYGAIVNPTVVLGEKVNLLSEAIKAGKLPATYINFDRKGHGTCLNYDYYDADPNGTAILIQSRETTKDKYGCHPKKDYYILRRVGRGVSVKPAPKHLVVKASKSSDNFGYTLAVCSGKESLHVQKTIAYKAVAVVNGQWRSIYRNRVRYEVGKTLRQRCQGGHMGGYYCYATPEEASSATVPTDSDNYSAPRVVIQVEVWGKSVGYGNGKMAYTYIKPLGAVK